MPGANGRTLAGIRLCHTSGGGSIGKRHDINFCGVNFRDFKIHHNTTTGVDVNTIECDVEFFCIIFALNFNFSTLQIFNGLPFFFLPVLGSMSVGGQFGLGKLLNSDNAVLQLLAAIKPSLIFVCAV